MHGAIRHLLSVFIHLGALGPLILGILDSSFLFLPFGNDLLVVLLTARDPEHFELYALTAAVGSTLGVVLLDAVCRKGGEQGLKRLTSQARIAYITRTIRKDLRFAIVLACLAPPPFPFTIVIGASSALQYPRARLLGTVFVSRTVRFFLISLLAVWQGRHILRIARSTEFAWFMTGLIALCLAGSAFQVVRWTRRNEA